MAGKNRNQKQNVQNNVQNKSAVQAKTVAEQTKKRYMQLATVARADLSSKYSLDDKNLFLELSGAIEENQLKTEGVLQRLAGLLYHIQKDELYKIAGYKSMAEYALQEHGISSKGGVSDAVNTFKRFGDMSTLTHPSDPNYGKLTPKYQKYAFSTLVAMKKLSDDGIDNLGITPEMSRKEVREIIKSAMILEDKAVAEEARKKSLIKELDSLNIRAFNAGIKREDLRNFIHNALPDFNGDVKTITVEQLEEVIRIVTPFVENAENAKPTSYHEIEGSAAEPDDEAEQQEDNGSAAKPDEEVEQQENDGSAAEQDENEGAQEVYKEFDEKLKKLMLIRKQTAGNIKEEEGKLSIESRIFKLPQDVIETNGKDLCIESQENYMYYIVNKLLEKYTNSISTNDFDKQVKVTITLEQE